MTKEETAEKLVELFPEKAPALAQHYADYDHQLLAHLFLPMRSTHPSVQCSEQAAAGKRFSNTALLLKRCITTAMKM